jgi:hypothetical protein
VNGSTNPTEFGSMFLKCTSLTKVQPRLDGKPRGILLIGNLDEPDDHEMKS